MPKVTEVFVAGGQPTYTYNPRAKLGLEDGVRRYLDKRYKILAVSGPTKSGKTVLLRTILPTGTCYWVAGGSITAASDLWDEIIRQSGDAQEAATTRSAGASRTKSVEASAGISKYGATIGAKAAQTRSETAGSSVTTSRRPSPASLALAALLRDKRPLVIDDFHYIDREVQKAVIRSLKEPVFDGVPVVVIAVPHRVLDAVVAEKEMTGRVEPLTIPAWQKDELCQIARNGLNELRIILSDETPILDQFAANAFASPHLMQDFCANACLDNKVKESFPNPTSISWNMDFGKFFPRMAGGSSKVAFERLARGARQRRDRILRPLRSGGSCDIYKAVLLAIAKTGPKDTISYEEIRTALKELLSDKVPQGQEVGAVLERMSEIAKTSEGEPVIEWVKRDSILHVVDPFFAYYLKWGT